MKLHNTKNKDVDFIDNRQLNPQNLTKKLVLMLEFKSHLICQTIALKHQNINE